MLTRKFSPASHLRDRLTNIGGRTWATVEFGQLTQNPNIQRIYRVNPQPRCEVELPSIIWERGRDAPMPILKPCIWRQIGLPLDPITTISIATSTLPVVKRTAGRKLEASDAGRVSGSL